LLSFTGTVSVTHNQTFTVTHDDGLTLIIGGLDLGFNPGPTAPTTTTITYTGATGNFPFQLVYGECCGGPAVLQSRATDDTGMVQPTRAQFAEERGLRGVYHYNAIASWRIDEKGEASNVYV